MIEPHVLSERGIASRTDNIGPVSYTHLLDQAFRMEFLREMSLVAEAVYNAFQPDKLNYELLGAGTGRHMHWHIFPRRSGDTPTGGPVWSLGAQLSEDKYLRCV